MNEDSFLPSKTRKISSVCKDASLSIKSNVIRNGQDRAHLIYGTDDDNCAYFAVPGEEITYSFENSEISSVHIVFDSDLNRKTLPGHWCEQSRNMRGNHMLNSPQMHMPETLCREFQLIGESGGERTEILNITNNRKRSYHVEVENKFDKLILIPISTWGNYEKIPVISFDFNLD